MVKNGLVSQAVKLKAKGLTQAQIADKLGVSQPAISRMLNNPKRQLEEEMGEQRVERAKESIEHFDVMEATKELVQLHIGVVREDPTDKGISGMAYIGLRLLAQLRGELIEKRDNRNRNEEVKDIDIPLFEGLCEKWGNSNGSDNGN